VTAQVQATGPAELADVVGQLVQDKVASRLAQKDHTLWGTAAEEESAKRLGWVDLHDTSRALLPQLDDLVSAARADGLDRVVLCGMGGSSLAPEVICGTAGKSLVVLDSTDPDTVRAATSADLERTIVVVSSKSGSTVETDSQRRAFLGAFEAAGIDGPSRIVIVTDPGSALEQLGRDGGYRAVVLADPTVGGRYSALTAFGLVPSALAGADVSALLDEAAAIAGELAADDASNPALVLGAALGASGASAGARRDKVAIVDAGGGLTGFGDWAEQLIAESTGKDGTGVLPVVVEDDAPETRWPASDVLTAGVAADDAKLSDREFHLTVVGALGAQLLLWEAATAVAGRLLEINPFDQPDVESAKIAARGLLDATPEPEPPLFVDGGIEVRGDVKLFGSLSDVGSAVAVLLDQLPEDGYLAVMAYLDRHEESALAATRQTLALRSERPTTFGWGPRFLHSTGQYHKGGAPIGVFLQVTGAYDEDLEIADRPFTFGQLLAAQAAGDAKVLADHGRPVLRLHLTDRAAGVARLLEVLR